MKLIHYSYVEDFGDEWEIHLLRGKRRSFLQIAICRDVYPGEPGFSLQLNPTNGLRFELDLGIICICKSFFGRHFD